MTRRPRTARAEVSAERAAVRAIRSATQTEANEPCSIRFPDRLVIALPDGATVPSESRILTVMEAKVWDCESTGQ